MTRRAPLDDLERVTLAVVGQSLANDLARMRRRTDQRRGKLTDEELVNLLGGEVAKARTPLWQRALRIRQRSVRSSRKAGKA